MKWHEAKAPQEEQVLHHVRIFPGEYLTVYMSSKIRGLTTLSDTAIELRVKPDGTIEAFTDTGLLRFKDWTEHEAYIGNDDE